MRVAKLLSIAAAAAVALVFAASFASAGEARPWLCRDKPVFSSTTPMAFSASAKPGAAWKLLLMQFEAGSAHDGFEIVSAHDLGSSGATASGALTPGRYFAVAMYRKGASWICPGYAADIRPAKLGEVGNICYAEDGPPCLVTLKITPTTPPTHPTISP
jgi:hypothetical protein